MTILVVKELRNTTSCDTYIAVMPHRGVAPKEIERLVRKVVLRFQRRLSPAMGDEFYTAVKQMLKGYGRVRKYETIHI